LELREATDIRSDLKRALEGLGDAQRLSMEEKGRRAALEAELEARAKGYEILEARAKGYEILEAKVKGYEILEAKVKGYEVIGGDFGESLDGLEGGVRRLESWCLDMKDAVRAVR
jgi:biotin operon repressor